jgi:hypothetical protein
VQGILQIPYLLSFKPKLIIFSIYSKTNKEAYKAKTGAAIYQVPHMA